MGYSNWSDVAYRARQNDRHRRGQSAFTYDQQVRSSGVRCVHGEMNPYGKTRESRDSQQHPDSVAIAVIFDVTGSMGRVPRVLQTKLGNLMRVLIDYGYVPHPQILFGAVGDAHCDAVPLQIGQFESGLEMDDDLGKFYLEGGGGGQVHESYELALYFMARHTVIDCYSRRGRKGYLFTIGDEKPYPVLRRQHILQHVGDMLDRDVPLPPILAAVQQRYHYFHIIPTNTAHGRSQDVQERWRSLLEERVLMLDDEAAVCEAIALTIGLNEGAVADVAHGVNDLPRGRRGCAGGNRGGCSAGAHGRARSQSASGGTLAGARNRPGLKSRSEEDIQMHQAILTVDLGFGDGGKGSIVDYLVRAHGAHTVVRYNGGAQAGHRVVTAEQPARSHVFAQFGSGTMAGAATHLSRFMLLDPLAMLEEEKHLRSLGVGNAFAQTTIDEHALVITPYQRAVNRLKELARGVGRHGSCGMGIGETVADYLAHGEAVLFAGDLLAPDRMYAKLSHVRAINLEKAHALQGQLQDHPQVALELDLFADSEWDAWLMAHYRTLADRAQIVAGDALAAILRRPGTVVFEGAQGVLLDEWRGFHPYTTWSTTTLANADRLLAEARYGGAVTRVGITRAYATRHGAGPFVAEDAGLTTLLPDPCNGDGPWQQSFRVGWPDLVMLRYARQVTGRLDCLAVTCMDRLAELPALQICRQYHCDEDFIREIAPGSQAHDLSYQQRLTQMLARCRPVLEPVSEPGALLAELAKALDTPIGILSAGPTSAEKRRINRVR